MDKKKFGLVACALALGVLVIYALFFYVRQYAFSQQFLSMGTYVNVTVCSSFAGKKGLPNVFNDLNVLLRDIENDMSVYRAESGVARLNAANGKAVRVSNHLFNILGESVRWSRKTQGKFDVTVGPLVALWKSKLAQDVVPIDEEVRSVNDKVGYEKIHLLDKGLVMLSDGAAIDLGAIAKGYAVDMAAKLLRKKGFNNFLVDAGGDIFVSGKNCRGKKWRIGIKDPKDENQLIAVIPVEDQAVTTSGDYEQFYEVDGRHWSHIIDPLSGYPAQGVVSATVIAPSTMEADVLSTALSIFPISEGQALIEDLGDGYSALMIPQDKSNIGPVRTQGFPEGLTY